MRARALFRRVGLAGRFPVLRDLSCGRFTDQELRRGEEESIHEPQGLFAIGDFARFDRSAGSRAAGQPAD